MTLLAATGYSSLDYPVVLDGMASGDATTRIASRDRNAWPRLGGCPSFVAACVAKSGFGAAPVTWAGSGAEGDLYVEMLAETGARTDGVARVRGERNPSAILAYQQDGSCVCLFDPVFPGTERITDKQRGIIASATHLCLSAGPPHLLRDVCGSRPSGARLYWIMKNDPNCFPPDAREFLSASADVLFCNHSERSLVGRVSGGATIVETLGPQGVRVERAGETSLLASEPVELRDSTGAGDTLAGGFIAAEMSGETSHLAAATRGIREAGELLRRRKELRSR